MPDWDLNSWPFAGAPGSNPSPAALAPSRRRASRLVHACRLGFGFGLGLTVTENERDTFTPLYVSLIVPANTSPTVPEGSLQVQTARPDEPVDRPNVANDTPASLPLHDNEPRTPFPVVFSLTVNDTENNLPAVAFPKLAAVDANFGFGGGGGGGEAEEVAAPPRRRCPGSPTPSPPNHPSPSPSHGTSPPTNTDDSPTHPTPSCCPRNSRRRRRSTRPDPNPTR